MRGGRKASARDLAAAGARFVATGRVITAWPARDSWLASASRRWSPTVAEITAGQVVCCYGKRNESHRARVTYRFGPDGARRYSDTLEFGDVDEGPRDEALRITSAYPVGATVTAYADPNDPRHSVLRPGRVSGSTPILLATGLCMTAAGVWLRLAARSRRRAMTPASARTASPS